MQNADQYEKQKLLLIDLTPTSKFFLYLLAGYLQLLI